MWPPPSVAWPRPMPRSASPRRRSFPTVTLTGNGGFESTRLQQWLSWPMRAWSVGPALALTLFDGGARRGAKAQAVAGYDEMVAAYRQTVLSAFQDVEDNLAAERLLTQEAERVQAAVAAAQRSLDISMNQYRSGLVSYLQVATQQTALLTNQQTAVSVTARRFVAAVQLVRALGGGWNGKEGDPLRPPPLSGFLIQGARVTLWCHETGAGPRGRPPCRASCPGSSRPAYRCHTRATPVDLCVRR